MLCYVWIVLVIGILIVQNHIQKIKYKKGVIPKKSNLLCRSRWAIILAGVGVLSYIIPIREFQAKYSVQKIENSLRLDTNRIKSYEKVPIRYFQEGLYPRDELDVLEADYRDLASWMDDNSVELHKNMNAYSIIEIDSLSMPVPNSVISDSELAFYRKSYLNAIHKYNEDVKSYNNVRHKIDVIIKLSMFFNYFMPIVIFLAIALQLNVVFWNYYEFPKQ